ncbi:MAG: iron-containing alcohol dehydrogenase [Oscillibacter sp.]|nr:iron-containing alcohol dehydrogenase [Oscillibacter sp.]
MSYQPFQFSQKTDYIFTGDVCEALKQQLELYKPAKLFVLASEKRFQLVSAALEALGQPYVLRTGCMSNPTAEFVNESAAILTAEGCDFLLGVGGGSVIDATKAIAILAANPTDGGVWDYVSFAKMPEKAALPLGLVVTIPSTGSESNPSAVISNPTSGEKLIYTESSLRPRFSITAPQLTYTLPAKPAGEGIADILSHLLEQYLHNDTNVDVSDNMLLGVMKAVVKWGPVAMAEPGNYDAKANLLWASYLAMSQVLSAGHAENWISHMVEHAISAKFDLAHGAGMSIVIPAYVSMVADTDASGRLARLSAEVFGAPDRSAAELLREFFASLGMPVTLSQAGIILTEEDAEECAAKAMPWGAMTVEGYAPFDAESAKMLFTIAR